MRDGQVDFNDRFFIELARSGPVNALVKSVAESVLANARASAPVETGDYRDRLVLRRKWTGKRWIYAVTGTNWKTLLVESRTGNLRRAMRRARGR